MDDKVVLVGNKPTMNYVMAVIAIFNKDGNEMILKARGRVISKAVDMAEIVRRRFLSDVVTNSITIGTQNLPRKEGGRTSNTSTIEIVLKK